MAENYLLCYLFSNNKSSTINMRKQMYQNMLNNLTPVNMSMLSNKKILDDIFNHEDVLTNLKKILLTQHLKIFDKHMFFSIFLYLVRKNKFENFTKSEIDVIENNYFDANIFPFTEGVHELAILLLKYDEFTKIKYNDRTFWFVVTEAIIKIIDKYTTDEKIKEYLISCLDKTIKVICSICQNNKPIHGEHYGWNEILRFIYEKKLTESQLFLFFQRYLMEIISNPRSDLTKIINYLFDTEILHDLFFDSKINNNSYFKKELLSFIKHAHMYTILTKHNISKLFCVLDLDASTIESLAGMFRFHNVRNKEKSNIDANQIAFVLMHQNSLIKITSKEHNVVSNSLKFMSLDELFILTDDTVNNFNVLEQLDLENDNHRTFFIEKLKCDNIHINKRIINKCNKIIKECVLNNNTSDFSDQAKILFLLYSDITNVTDEQILNIISSCEEFTIIKIIKTCINDIHLNDSSVLPNKESLNKLLTLCPKITDYLFEKKINKITEDVQKQIIMLKEKRSIENLYDDKLNSKYLCKICLEDEISKIFECNHMVCEKCSDRIKDKCPYCRKLSVCKDMFI